MEEPGLISPNPTKICVICKLEKPTTSFYPNYGGKSGVRTRCKQCDSKQNAEYKKRNPDKCRGYRQKHYLANSETVRKATSTYAKEHLDKRRWYDQKRRASRVGVTAELIDKHLVHREQGGTCAYCGKELDTDFHLDHIIPLSKGGITLTPM